MEFIRTTFLAIVEIVVAIILINAFTPILRELNQESFIPLLWFIVIIAIVGIFVGIIRGFNSEFL